MGRTNNNNHRAFTASPMKRMISSTGGVLFSNTSNRRTTLLVATSALLLLYVVSLIKETATRRLHDNHHQRLDEALSNGFEDESSIIPLRVSKKQRGKRKEEEADTPTFDDDEIEGPARKIIKSDEDTTNESEFVESLELRKEAESEVIIVEEDNLNRKSPWSKPVAILPSRRSNITKSLKLNATNPAIFETFDGGVHLITTFYKGSYAQQRFKEIVVVMRRNLKNPHLTALHALWEDVDPIAFVPEPELNSKLVRARFGRQPAYKDMFDYANRFLRRGSVAIISNSDIHFDETLKCVKPVPKDRKIFNNTFNHLGSFPWSCFLISLDADVFNPIPAYALSRHPAPPCDKGRHDMCSSYIGSHDAFLFAPPVPAKFAAKLDFTQNHIG